MFTMKCTVFYKNEYSVQNKRSKQVGCLFIFFHFSFFYSDKNVSNILLEFFHIQ